MVWNGSRNVGLTVAEKENRDLTASGMKFTTYFQVKRSLDSIEHLNEIVKGKRLDAQQYVKSEGGGYVVGPAVVNTDLEIQGLERRIKFLQDEMLGVQIVGIPICDVVVVGTSVRVIDDLKQKHTYNIVGLGPSDARKFNEVKYTSPVGKALFGREVEEEVEYVVEGQKRCLEIKSIGIYNPND